MTNMPMYEYSCSDCEMELELVVPYSEREEQFCNNCTEKLTRKFPSPRVMTASWPDGTKRPGVSELREAAKLDRALLEKKWSERRNQKQGKKVDVVGVSQMREEIANLKQAAGDTATKKKVQEDKLTK